MADKTTYIKLDRNITKWRWYQNPNTFRVWIHLLLTANYEDRGYEDITIHRGELLLNYNKIAVELGMSYQAVRTAVTHLKSTGELTARREGNFSIISIVSYDEYQSNQQANQQRINSASTAHQQSLKKYKKYNNNKNIYSAFGNVALDDAEYAQLAKDFPNDYKRLIEELGEYKAKYDVQYANDYAALQTFAKRQELVKAEPNKGYEIETRFDFVMGDDGYEYAKPYNVRVYPNGAEEVIPA